MSIFLLLTVWGQVFFAQSNDSLITINEINFNSRFEEDAIKDFFLFKNSDYLKLFLISSGIDNTDDYEKLKTQFTNFYLEVNNQRLSSFSEEKKIKIIYKEVHNRFFKQYELKTKFSDIFKNGNFNCVTASALYGIILSDLKIPFSVKETPVHVYLVAYPKTQNIKIESTDPLKGYYAYDQRSKKEFADYLLNNKLISETEFNSTSVEDLFNKHFYPDNNIGIKELIGIHYFNSGLYKLEEKQYKQAYIELEKSYLFYPSEKAKYVMISILSELVRNHDYDSINNLDYLIKIAEFSNIISTKEIRDEFAIITYNYLVTKSNIEYYEKIYSYLISKLESKELIDEISFIYNYEKGRFLINKGNTSQAHEYFARAYSIKPEHYEAQTGFVQSLALLIENLHSNEAISKIENYYVNDSTLDKNDIFKQLLLRAYLVGAYEDFNLQLPKQGEDYLKKFEDVFSKNTNINVGEVLIVDAYSSAGIYYFKKGNYNRSKEFINKGLSYAPNNYKLIMIKNSL